MNDTNWKPPPGKRALSKDEVHVWRLRLAQPPAAIERLGSLLAADEVARAARFHFPTHRARFIVARAALRALLGQYLELPADQIRFRYTSHGKPELAEGFAKRQTPIQFNLSHSEGLALFAFANQRKVGIDLERLRQDVAVEQLAKRFLSPGEQSALFSLPERHRTRAFFDAWTRKEAYLKAQGNGLALALDRFDVSLAPGEPALLLSTPYDPQETTRWSLREIYPAPGYAAALAVEGQHWALSCFHLDDRVWPGKDNPHT